MSRRKLVPILFLIIALLLRFIGVVYAQPVMPSNFYGDISISDPPTSVGDTIEAYVPGVADSVGTCQVLLDGETLVYSIDVYGDDLETGIKEGGAENDEITFMIGKRIVAKAVWHTGANVRVDFHPPDANAGGSYSGVVGEEISFTGTASDAGGDIDTYHWDWDNDGIYDSTGQSAAHSWDGIGTYTVGLKVLDDQKGESTATASVTISSATVVVTADSGQSKVFGDSDPAELTYSSSIDGVPFTGSLTRSPGETVGSYAITQGTLDAGENYVISFIGADFTITPKPVTITPDAGQNKVFGSADPVLTYTASETVTLTGALDRVEGENTGEYAITLGTLTADENHSLVLNPEVFTITSMEITVTADGGITKIFGDSDPVFTYTSSDAVDFTGVLSRVSGENVGKYAITIGTLSAGANYSINLITADFTITAKPITVTVTPGQSKVFDEADPASYAYTSSDPAAIFSGTLTRVAGEDVGEYEIQQNDLDAGTNYTITFVPANFTITPKPITVTVTPGQSKVFGEADPASYAYTSSDPAAIFSGTLTRVAGEDVGEYEIQQNDLSAGTNYTITFVPANFTITPKPITVTADSGKTKVFGETDPLFTYTSTDSSAPFTGVLSRESGEDAGVYAITEGSLNPGTNYAMTFVSADFTITPKPIVVWADSGLSKEYSDADPLLTYTSDEPGAPFTGFLSRAGGENVGTYAIEINTLTAGGNYDITFVSADFSIVPKPTLITFGSLVHVYDGTGKTVSITTDPVGVSVEVTYDGSITAPSAIGSYAVVATVTDSNYSGTATETMNIYASHNISLELGWNLVSFNVHPVSTAVEDVLSSITGNYDLVYVWNAVAVGGSWLKADNVPISPDSLHDLDETMGFWIHMTAADTLEVVGTLPVTTDISLDGNAGGWNLVGYPSSITRDLPSAVSDYGVGENFTLIYSYRAADTVDLWKLYDLNGPTFVNDLTQLSPGWGYWIKITADNTWSVGY